MAAPLAYALDLWWNRLALRSQLTPADRALVLGLPGEVQQIASNRDIVRLGECVTRACLIADGTAARFGQTRDGLRQLTAVYIPGDMCDLHSVVLPLATSAIQALSATTVVRVPHQALKDIGEASPALGRAFWRDCVADAQIATEWLINNSRRDARSRIAHLLCEIAVRSERIGRPRDHFPLGMTQIHIGDATGLTPVHVNRTLRDLRERGLVEVPPREVRILDWNGLRDCAEFDPAYLHFHSAEP
jgi:CRP-like cAMP-binding protein